MGYCPSDKLEAFLNHCTEVHKAKALIFVEGISEEQHEEPSVYKSSSLKRFWTEYDKTTLDLQQGYHWRHPSFYDAYFERLADKYSYRYSGVVKQLFPEHEGPLKAEKDKDSST